MLSNLKYMFKRYFILVLLGLLINIPIIILGTTRTDQVLILEGGIERFSSIVNVDTTYKEKGSFNTTYVVSMNRSTKLQNMITDLDPSVERYTPYKGDAVLSDYDTNFAGRIEYASSVQTSIILAYNEAKKDNPSINIDYEYSGMYIDGYGKGMKLGIGERILGISYKDSDGNYQEVIDYKDSNFKYYFYMTMKPGDKMILQKTNGYVTSKLNVSLKSDTYEYILSENDLNYYQDSNVYQLRASLYDMYDINHDTLLPKISIKTNDTGGPSGGLLQTLSIYNALVSEDITHGYKIAGTGTIDRNGNVGMIGGIKEKIPTAIHNNVDIFLCVKGNYSDAKKSYDSTIGHSKMKLVSISTFYEALDYLKNIG